MRIKRKLSQNREGVSGGVWVILIILLGLIGWQFAGGYFGIITPSQWIAGSVNEEIPEAITMEMVLSNPVTSKIWLQDTNQYYWQNGSDMLGVEDDLECLDIRASHEPEYDDEGVRITITTNAPSIIIGAKYRLVGLMEKHKTFGNEFLELVNEQFDYEGAGVKTIYIEILHNTFVSYSAFQWNELDFILYDPSNTAILHFSFAVVRG